MSSVIYYALNLAFPVPGKAKGFREVDVSGVADDARSGMADDARSEMADDGASERRKDFSGGQTHHSDDGAGDDPDKKDRTETVVYEAA